jgi:hypothetical protein
MRAVRNPGKKAGSPRTSMLGWQALKTNPSKTGAQRALHFRCGREKILALGLCATCYTLKRQDAPFHRLLALIVRLPLDVAKIAN